MKRAHSNYFTTVHTDYAKPQTPWMPNAPFVEEARPAPRAQREPIRRVLPPPLKQSQFQKR